MPTYEYQCQSCGFQFEKEQRITEDPIKKCPKCGKAKAQRLLSSGNFILKGGGWYADLYASSSTNAAKESTPSSASTSSPPASASKSDATSIPKSESVKPKAAKGAKKTP